MAAHHEEDDEKPKAGGDGTLLKEFDCPECNAHNPCDEKIDRKGTEIRCNYCGVEFKVTLTDEGRIKFKEI